MNNFIYLSGQKKQFTDEELKVIYLPGEPKNCSLTHADADKWLDMLKKADEGDQQALKEYDEYIKNCDGYADCIDGKHNPKCKGYKK